jgi:hypothetical protein
MIIEWYALKCFAMGAVLTAIVCKKFYRVRVKCYEIREFSCRK